MVDSEEFYQVNILAMCIDLFELRLHYSYWCLMMLEVDYFHHKWNN